MEPVMSRLTDDERKVRHIIRRNKYIYSTTLAKHHITLGYFKFILLNSFGRRLESTPQTTKNYRKYRVVKVDKRQDYNQVLPCMLPRASVTRCGHARTCYLSRHCPAAQMEGAI